MYQILKTTLLPAKYILIAAIFGVFALPPVTADARNDDKWDVDPGTTYNPGGQAPPGQQGSERDGQGWNTTPQTVTNPGGNQPPGQQDK
jgi:hypothetical protein